MSRILVLAALLSAGTAATAQQPTAWPQHSRERPAPPVAVAPRLTSPAPAPAGATILFDGRDLAQWKRSWGGGAAGWKLVDGGAMEVVPGAGPIETIAAFGDVHLHIEWASPNPAIGRDQDRGNSGAFLMGRYEVQILDSYESRTYADGQAGSIYGQFPPRVNVTQPPGEWNSYDIEFRRPRFTADGKLVSPARMTVRHNGVVVQADVALLGPTSHTVREPYTAHADALPISLQDHGHTVRFRNIWVVPLAPAAADLTRGARLDPSIYGIWYHLGVLRFAQGEFNAAAEAFRRAQPIGEITPEQVFTPADTADTQQATLSFGLGNYFLVRGDTAQARLWFERAVWSGGWPAFGAIVAEAELNRLRGPR